MKETNAAARVRKCVERRALKQSKRVAWPHLASAVEEYTDWHVFALWVRATVDAAGKVLPNVQFEMEQRAPDRFKESSQEIRGTTRRNPHAHATFWEEAISWAEMNVFLRAKRGGWVDALRYFSAMSLRSMQAWSLWEHMNVAWRVSPPARYPTLSEWERMVESVSRLSNEECPAQNALTAMESMPKPDWDTLMADFARLNTFCLWMESLADAPGSDSGQIRRELMNTYSGFDFSGSRGGSKAIARQLYKWVLRHELARAKAPEVRAALRFCLRNQPEYVAVRNYGRFCREVWAASPQKHFQDFAEWKQSADHWCEAD